MMKVNIICGEDLNTWIVGKFARKLNDELNRMGITSGITKDSRPEADVNHYILYDAYKNRQKSRVDTLMITHLDTQGKYHHVKKQLEIADMGVCLSSRTVEYLVQAGVPREKLCYINPAHDELIKPRPIVIGITTRIYPDGRKNEHWVLDLIRRIDPKVFKFKIMGEGWQSIVDAMRKNLLEVEYYENFDYEVYKELIPTADYYLYVGKDEGSMGFIDALTAGVPTIVTPQGFHLDAVNGITYPVDNFDDLLNVFSEIALKRKRLTDSVSNWTWEEYAKKHVEMWTAILARTDRSAATRNASEGPGAMLASRGRIWLELRLKGIFHRFFKRKLR
ncbi:MAG: hypothetical protein ABSG82_01190 [Sedimentisphaerales bacterium]|jgi:hypothetical protein